MGVNLFSQLTKLLLVCATGGLVGAFTSVMAISAISDDPDMILNFISLASVLFYFGLLFFFYSSVPWLIKNSLENPSTKLKPWQLCVLAIGIFLLITFSWSYEFENSNETDMMFATPFVCVSYQNALSKNADYISLNPKIQLMCEEKIRRAHKDYRNASSKKDAGS